MKLIDTYEQIIAQFSSGFDLERWYTYGAGIFPALPQMCIQSSEEYCFDTQVLPVILQALASKDKLEQAHYSFITATDDLSQRFEALFGMSLDTTIVFYLGLCNGAGWVTRVEQCPTILLGVEKIIELNWHTPSIMQGLIYHELGHIWHSSVGSMEQKPEGAKQQAVWQLYVEGVACQCEQLLAGHADQYHFGSAQWLAWCKRNETQLVQEYWRRIQAGESVQDFFGDWCSYQNHSNVGYYLGTCFVRWLIKRSTLLQAVQLSPPQAEKLFGEFAESRKEQNIE